jgi:hypothetical protein
LLAPKDVNMILGFQSYLVKVTTETRCSH